MYGEKVDVQHFFEVCEAEILGRARNLMRERVREYNVFVVLQFVLPISDVQETRGLFGITKLAVNLREVRRGLKERLEQTIYDRTGWVASTDLGPNDQNGW